MTTKAKTAEKKDPEYKCPKCGDFEVTQRITEPALERHECGSRVKRQISLTSFALKGGGWYADGYRSSRSRGSSASAS